LNPKEGLPRIPAQVWGFLVSVIELSKPYVRFLIAAHSNRMRE